MPPVATPAAPAADRGGVRRPAVPPLQNGDNLTAAEFVRRLDAMLHGTRAELVGGMAFMPSPVSLGWSVVLGYYEGFTPGIIGGTDTTVRLDDGDMPQPDVCLMIDPALGGRATIDAEQRIVGGPELVAEVAASTATYDLHQKLAVYRRHGVLEYLVWRTLDAAFDHFTLRGDAYDRVVRPADGVIRSLALPGLWVNTAALVAGDTPAALATLTTGMASPEHAAFAAELRRRRAERA